MNKIDAEMVADVYERACQTGEPPTLTVAQFFGISRAAAAKRVDRARKSGHLQPSLGQGRYVGAFHSRKLRAVAAAVGVPPEKLAAAIREYANGDLRLSAETEAPTK